MWKKLVLIQCNKSYHLFNTTLNWAQLTNPKIILKIPKCHEGYQFGLGHLELTWPVMTGFWPVPRFWPVNLTVQTLRKSIKSPKYLFCSRIIPEPINIFQTLNQQHSKSELINAPIRLCYHRGTHYNSLVDPNKATIGVGLGLPGFVPGLADRNQVGLAWVTQYSVVTVKLFRRF